MVIWMPQICRQEAPPHRRAPPPHPGFFRALRRRFGMRKRKSPNKPHAPHTHKHISRTAPNSAPEVPSRSRRATPHLINKGTPATMSENSAFVFIKPHAHTKETIELVKKTFAEKKISILKEGELEAATIDEKKLIDQHYYARIASKGDHQEAAELNVPADKFEAKFGISWQSALDDGKVFNALDGCAKLGIDADAMDKNWGIEEGRQAHQVWRRLLLRLHRDRGQGADLRDERLLHVHARQVRHPRHLDLHVRGQVGCGGPQVGGLPRRGARAD